MDLDIYNKYKNSKYTGRNLKPSSNCKTQMS